MRLRIISLYGHASIDAQHKSQSENKRAFIISGVYAALCLAMLFPVAADARIKRSQSAKVEFKAEHPCPANGARKGPCKGFVIDHINPLACGGADAPANMAWQTVAEGKAKDKWERNACSK